MRKVYICSPYRAKDGAELDRNIDYAQQLTRQALEAGLAPITQSCIAANFVRAANYIAARATIAESRTDGLMSMP